LGGCHRRASRLVDLFVAEDSDGASVELVRRDHRLPPRPGDFSERLSCDWALHHDDEAMLRPVHIDRRDADAFPPVRLRLF
jgi:hypothetical protein